VEFIIDLINAGGAPQLRHLNFANAEFEGGSYYSPDHAITLLTDAMNRGELNQLRSVNVLGSEIEDEWSDERLEAFDKLIAVADRRRISLIGPLDQTIPEEVLQPLRKIFDSVVADTVFEPVLLQLIRSFDDLERLDFPTTGALVRSALGTSELFPKMPTLAEALLKVDTKTLAEVDRAVAYYTQLTAPAQEQVKSNIHTWAEQLITIIRLVRKNLDAREEGGRQEAEEDVAMGEAMEL
jgi:hypothetical protein